MSATAAYRSKKKTWGGIKNKLFVKNFGARRKTQHSPQLVINYEHTGVHLLPVSRWTIAEKGTEKVTIVGLDDKA